MIYLLLSILYIDMEAFDPKSVNPILDIIRVSSFRLGGIFIYVTDLFTLTVLFKGKNVVSVKFSYQ